MHRQLVQRMPQSHTDERDVHSVPLTRRRCLVTSSLGLVEDYWCRGANRRRTPDGHSPDFQIALPYHGTFVWHVGRDAIVSDANQVLFIAGGEDFHVSEPVPGAYAELIVTPHIALMAELLGTAAHRLARHPAFRRRRALANPETLLWRAHVLHAGRRDGWSGLAGDEAMVRLLGTALGTRERSLPVTGATKRLIDRTKGYVAARLASRLLLTEIATAVGASPAYLTDVFRRFEGLPLHRYVRQLRLARALVELPHAEDITTLALNLGFSSHSHFTATFRSAFACTPSAFRAQPGAALGAIERSR